MSRELMPKSGIMMPHVVINRDAAVVGVSTVDGVAGAVDLTGKYLQKTDAEATYLTKTDGATKTFVTDAIGPIMEGALFKADPFVDNNIPFRSAGANGVESVDMIKVTPENSIKLGSYESSVQGVEIHSAGRLQVVDQDDSGVETKYPVYSKRYRPEIEDLPFAAIGSYVKDSKGRTVGVTRTGINSDIKQLTQKVTFTQPVTVADAVGDYDAVTLRQLRNSGGGGGPTMSGISNFGIGDFHLRDSRAFIPAFEVVSDGQLLSRADYPDLWAYAQLLTPIADSVWLGDTQQRGKYSTGDGSTTFRVPDRNGVQSGSIKELFARGDGGSSSSNGLVYEAAAPNIGGEIPSFYGFQPNAFTGASGALRMGGKSEATPISMWNNSHPGQEASFDLKFNASISDASYGRYGITGNILPRNFVGVWTIRAHGGFTAANTSWSVINSDATAPSPGVNVQGGLVRSEYKIGTDLTYSATLSAYGEIDGISGTSGAKILNGSQEWKFNNAGTLVLPNAVSQLGTERPDGAINVDAYLRPKDLVAQPLNTVGVAPSENNGIVMTNFTDVPAGGYVNSISGDWYTGKWFFGGVRAGGASLDRVQLNIKRESDSPFSEYKFGSDGVASCQEWRSTSDERVKSGISRIQDPLNKMRNIKGATWTLETNGSIGYGFLAQDVEKDFPEAVSEIKNAPTTLRDGSVVNDVKTVNTSGVAAALHHEAILALMEKIEALESKIEELSK